MSLIRSPLLALRGLLTFSRPFSTTCSHNVRGNGINNGQQPEELVTTTDDGSVIVMWHPEPKFPYECTRPMPRMDQRDKEGGLRTGSREARHNLDKYDIAADLQRYGN